MVVRRVGRWGHSLAVTLSPAAVRALGVTKGSALVLLVTPEGTVELQPLAPPTPAVATRREASALVEGLQAECVRLRAQAQESYKAGFNAGYFAGQAAGSSGVLSAIQAEADLLGEFRQKFPGQIFQLFKACVEALMPPGRARRARLRRPRRRPGKMLEAPWSGWSPRPARPRALAPPPAPRKAPPALPPLLPPPPSP